MRIFVDRRPSRTALLVLCTSAAAAVTVACTAQTGSTFSPSSAQHGARTGSASSPLSAHHATAAAFTVGVDLNMPRSVPVAAAKAAGCRDMRYLRQALGVRAVQIAWDFDLPSADASQVDASGSGTASPAAISAVTTCAKRAGFTVSYRVILRVPGPVTPLRPAEPSVFLASLLAAERPYLALGQQERIDQFIAGTERTSIANLPQWTWFFAQAARVYHGSLSYAQWGGEPGDGGFFFGDDYHMPVQDLGVTAYPNISLPPSASTAELTASWERVLSGVPSAVLHRTTIDEIGIPALTGAYERPWDWPGTGKPDDQVQARWFAAACTAARAERMRGIFFWNLNLADNPAHPFPSPVKFTGRPASVAAVRACAETAS